MFGKDFPSAENILKNRLRNIADNMLIRFGYEMEEVHSQDQDSSYCFQPQVRSQMDSYPGYNIRATTIEEMDELKESLEESLRFSNQKIKVTVESRENGSLYIKMQQIPAENLD